MRLSGSLPRIRNGKSAVTELSVLPAEAELLVIPVAQPHWRAAATDGANPFRYVRISPRVNGDFGMGVHTRV
jgi:hypothetical protein